MMPSRDFENEWCRWYAVYQLHHSIRDSLGATTYESLGTQCCRRKSRLTRGFLERVGTSERLLSLTQVNGPRILFLGEEGRRCVTQGA